MKLWENCFGIPYKIDTFMFDLFFWIGTNSIEEWFGRRSTKPFFLFGSCQLPSCFSYFGLQTTEPFFLFGGCQLLNRFFPVAKSYSFFWIFFQVNFRSSCFHISSFDHVIAILSSTFLLFLYFWTSFHIHCCGWKCLQPTWIWMFTERRCNN